MELQMSDSRDSSVRNLSQHFTQKIHRGEWKAGQHIPTEAELMQHYNASRYAIRAALKSLENRGWMKAVPGSGRQVTGETASRHLRIGLLVRQDGYTSVGQGFLTQMAINSALAGYGHDLLTFSINNQLSTLTESTSGLGIEKAELDGVIVFARQYRLEDIERFSRCMPTIVMGQDASPANVPSFFIDFGYHAATAVMELLRRGHKRVALIDSVSSDRLQLSADIRRGFELGLHLAGVSPDCGAVCQLSDGPDCAKWLAGQTPDITSAVFYYLPRMEALYATMKDRGPALPKKFEAICMCDLSSDRLSNHWPDFECPFDRIGRDAVDCLLGMIAGEESKQFSNPYFGKFRGFRTK